MNDSRYFKNAKGEVGKGGSCRVLVGFWFFVGGVLCQPASLRSYLTAALKWRPDRVITAAVTALFTKERDDEPAHITRYFSQPISNSLQTWIYSNLKQQL